MAGRYAKLTERRIAKLEKEGRGKGVGKEYKPWITVNDFSSLGRVHRRLSITSDRVVHLFSDIEEDVFLSFDGRPEVLDIREQFPLPRFETMAIAERLGVRHPMVDGVPVVMTTDLLIDKQGHRLALAVKPISALEDRRTLEKLDIEKTYWGERSNVRWHLLTDASVTRDARIGMQERADWSHERLIDADPTRDWRSLSDTMLVAVADGPRGRLNDFCRRVETREGWSPGEGISTLKLLLARRLLRLVGTERLDPFADVAQLAIA